MRPWRIDAPAALRGRGFNTRWAKTDTRWNPLRGRDCEDLSLAAMYLAGAWQTPALLRQRGPGSRVKPYSKCSLRAFEP